MTLLDLLLLGAIVGLLWLGMRWISAHSYMRVNPRYRRHLERHGLAAPRALLELPAVIVSGHPDRNVARVTLGIGADAVSAYLKREHRVRWKQRLANLWAGFGLSSLSHREAITLKRLRHAGFHCPDWIAVGADCNGRAFLLIQEVGGTVDLRRFLAASNLSSRQRLDFARNLGETIARLHDAGFAHVDLYAKHFLVDPHTFQLSILDWQRCGRPHRVTWPEAWRDLAALDATLADELATPRERLACLRAYVTTRLAASRINARKKILARACKTIRQQRRLLLERRHIREARQLPATNQELMWLDGEALCMTPEFYRECNGLLRSSSPLSRNSVLCETTPVPQGRQAFLVRRRTDRMFAWLATWFGRPITAPEVRQAGLLFRLQRYGVRTSRLLAFGQRQVSPWRLDSFLLTEPPPGAQNLADWLARSAERLSDDVTLRQRRMLLREIGLILQRLHAAGCYLRDRPSTPDEPCPWFSVHEFDEDRLSRRPLAVSLTRVDGLRLQRQPNEQAAVRDLVSLLRFPEARHLNRTDGLRVLLAYLACPRLTHDAKQFVRCVTHG